MSLEAALNKIADAINNHAEAINNSASSLKVLAKAYEGTFEGEEILTTSSSSEPEYYFCDGVVREGKPIGGMDRCKPATKAQIAKYIKDTAKTDIDDETEEAKKAADKKAAAKKAADKKAAAKKLKEVEDAEEKEGANADDGQDEQLDKAQLIALLTEVTKKTEDRTTALSILEKVGGSRRLNDIPLEKYAAIATALREAAE